MFAQGYRDLPGDILVCYILTPGGLRRVLLDGDSIIGISPALFSDDTVRIEIETRHGHDVLCVLCADAGSLLRSPLSVSSVADEDQDDDEEIDWDAIQTALLPAPSEGIICAPAEAHQTTRDPEQGEMQDKGGLHRAGKACSGAITSVGPTPKTGSHSAYAARRPAYGPNEVHTDERH